MVHLNTKYNINSIYISIALHSLSPPGHGVRLTHDDEGRLLEEGDADVELLRDPGGRHVAVVRPHDVLDHEAALRAPGANLRRKDVEMMVFDV